MSDPKTDIEDLDAEIQGMRARVAELEEEADKKAEAAAMQALLNGEAETPFTAKEVAKGENGASDAAADGTTEVEVEEEDPAAVDGRSVYVGNVDYGATPEELQQHFLSCGSINRITIVCDKFTGNPKGYAYVEFSDPTFVDTAVALNDSLFRGRLIKVVAKRTNIPGFNQRGRGRGRGGYRGGYRGGAPQYNPYSRPRGRGRGRGRGF